MSCIPAPSPYVKIFVVSEQEPLINDPQINLEKHDEYGGYYLYKFLTKIDSSSNDTPSNDIAVQLSPEAGDVEFYKVGNKGTYILNLTSQDFFCVRHHKFSFTPPPRPYENNGVDMISKDGKMTKEIALVKERQMVRLSKDDGLVFGLEQYLPNSIESNEKDPIVYKLYTKEKLEELVKKEQK